MFKMKKQTKQNAFIKFRVIVAIFFVMSNVYGVYNSTFHYCDGYKAGIQLSLYQGLFTLREDYQK